MCDLKIAKRGMLIGAEFTDYWSESGRSSILKTQAPISWKRLLSL